jgi:hypothetical protein
LISFFEAVRRTGKGGELSKVWLITTGEQGQLDYQIFGVFSSHDKARNQAHLLDIEFRKQWGKPTDDIANDPWFHHFIEEYELNPVLVKEED